MFLGTCKIDNVKYELNQTLNHEDMLLLVSERFSKLSMMVCCEIKSIVKYHQFSQSKNNHFLKNKTL